MTRSLRMAGYGAAVFITSACGLILEIVAGRLIAPYVGMSLYTWTAIIAVVLAGFSAGHWIGGRLAGADCDASVGERRVAYALALAAASSLATPLLLRWVAEPLLSAALPVLAAIVALAGALFFLPSLFVGIVSPILTKLAVDAAPERTGPVIGRMYALGAVGSIAGTLAAGYIFISWIGSIGTVLAVTASYAVLAVLFALSGRVTGTVAALMLILGGGFGIAGTIRGTFTGPCTIESSYYCIRIDDVTRQFGRPSAALVLDHLAHGVNDRDDPRHLHSGYLRFLAEYTRYRWTAGTTGPRVLLVGGGALTFPRALVAERTDATVLAAELDPAVTQIVTGRLWVAPSPRIEIAHGDARATLKALPRRPLFDLVLTDVFHDIAMPAHLVTREFHRELRARMAADGIYAVNVIESAADPRFLRSFVRTLAEDFAAVEVWVDAETASASRRITYGVLAAAAPSGAGRIRLPGGNGTWRRLGPGDIAQESVMLDVPILTDDYAPVDRLLAHVLLDRELGER